MSAPVGLLNTNNFYDNCSLTRFHPSSALQPYIEHYWYINWQLPVGQCYEQSVIPHPNTHLIFLAKNSHIQGICKQKYSYTLTEKGDLIGVKFTPAGFYDFAQQAGFTMNDISNVVVDIDKIFDIDVKAAELKVQKLTTPLKKIAYIDQILFSSRQPILKKDNNISFLNSIVADIQANKNLMSVSDIVNKYSISQRQLQRLFAKYIGVNVKWVINRYRIHDALTEIEMNAHVGCDTKLNWASLALQLGYYDQAHFIHDFSQLIGQSPKNYQATIC